MQTNRTNFNSLDLPSRALMLQQVRQTQRISLCPMCASVRSRVVTEEGPVIVCRHCGDTEPVKEKGEGE
jgi:uncharacterized radical SAM superfamily Fe-S cluster-containing enzyme